MTKQKIIWQFIILGYAAFFSFALIENSRGPIYPNILNEFKLTPSLGSWIFSLASASGLITTLLGNKWLRHFGTIKSLQIALILQIISSVGIGASASLNYNYSLLLIFSLVFGISTAAIGICGNLMISKGSPIKRRRQLLSGLHSMYGLGSFVAPLFISFCYQFNLTWYQFFYLIALFPLCLFIGSSFNHQKINSTSLNVDNKKISFKLALIPSLIFGFYVASEIIVSSRLVYYMEFTYGWDKAASNTYLSIFFLTLLTGRLLFSFFKFPGKSFYWLYISLISSLIFYIIGFTTHPIFLALLGLTQSFFFACGMDWLYQKYHKYADSMVSYIMTFVSLGLIAMHFTTGIISTHYSITTAMKLGPCLAFASLILLIICHFMNSEIQ